MDGRFTTQESEGSFIIPQCKKCVFEDANAICLKDAKTPDILQNKTACKYLEERR